MRTIDAVCVLVALSSLAGYMGDRVVRQRPRPAAPSAAAATVAEPEQRPVGTGGAPRRHVAVDFQNVHFTVLPGVVLEVGRLQGTLDGTRPGSPPSFDDLGSYSLAIDAGEIGMTPASLSTLLNTSVFHYDGAPISDIEISIENGRLKQKGSLRKGLRVPFTVVADVSVTADGRIRLHPASVKAGPVPAKGLMKLFGLELADLIASNRDRGFEVVDDDLLLAPERLLPQPRVTGRLTGIRIENGRIVETFGAHRPTGPDRVARNYMYYRGGVLQFGKLTMSDTDLRLVDADPSDPFAFSPAQYARQLTAGYSKSLANGGLRTYMPDLDDIGRR